MRGIVLILLSVCLLVAAACTPEPLPYPAPGAPTPTPKPLSVLTTEPSAAAPTQEAAPATVEAAPQPATAAPAATALAGSIAANAPAPTEAPVPVATQPALATTAPAVAGKAKTFTSPALGITFSYLDEVAGTPVGLLEQPDRVYLYVGLTAPTDGQWVQVFQKPASQSMVDAIKAQVLNGYSTQDCFVVQVSNPEQGQQWPAGYTFARIDVPRSADDDMGTLSAKAAKCPQPYAAVGGLAYFVSDAKHPDRFAFFSIGQYYIPAGTNRPWQTTLRFIGPSAPPTVPPTTSSAPYLDDRSTAESVMGSYVNALNHYEYARAYSYWNVQAGLGNGLVPFNQFRRGYANTQSVDLQIGQVSTDVGAGQLYYWVPVTLIGHTRDGATQTYVGCYRMHLGRPGFQAVPPFRPLAIESAKVKQVANNANTNALMASACLPGGQPMPPSPAPSPSDISPARYLDDRTDGVQVLRSLFNAVNRQEYARAYSYWEPGSAQRPPFAKFQQGYADTASVDMVAGLVTPDAGAGNIYYQVPVVLTARTNAGKVQTFAGCYVLHMVNPGMQTNPPFAPLGIRSATVRQVPNNSDPQPLLQSACTL